jgi:hypothetical protein
MARKTLQTKFVSGNIARVDLALLKRLVGAKERSQPKGPLFSHWYGVTLKRVPPAER